MWTSDYGPPGPQSRFASCGWSCVPWSCSLSCDEIPGRPSGPSSGSSTFGTESRRARSEKPGNQGRPWSCRDRGYNGTIPVMRRRPIIPEGSTMSTDDHGSVTRWLGGAKAGGDTAARELWRRYFESLVRLARARLRASPRTAEDEEDVALSAFDSFLAGAARGRFPRLDDRHDLWRILVTITTRKALDQVNRQRRRKRGGGRVVVESALPDDS